MISSFRQLLRSTFVSGTFLLIGIMLPAVGAANQPTTVAAVAGTDTAPATTTSSQPTTPSLAVRNLRVTSSTATSLDLAWDSEAPYHSVESRRLPEGEWTTAPNVREKDYNLIFLQPESEYEIRVRGLAAMNDTSSGSLSETIRARTTQLQPTRFAGLTVSPPEHLDTFTSGTWYPTVEYHDGFLWVLESIGGALHLSKVEPKSRKSLWTKVAVPPAREDRDVYQGIMDMAVHDGKLWICWNVQDTLNPDGYHISQSRQMLRSYDFKTEEFSDPVTVEPIRSGEGTWEGGIESWRGKLWVMQMDTRLEGEKRRTRIVLRPFEKGTFGEPVVYENCPTPYPYGPSISVFQDKLLLLFSDLAAYEQDRNREPLLYTLFDGESFSPARTVQETGRSRYAKGVQMGERFVCVYKCNLPYYRATGNRFHDLALSVIDPAAEKVWTTMLVSDRKYNSSPDITLTGPDSAVMVFAKFEHIYTDKADPAANYGSFIAEVKLEP